MFRGTSVVAQGVLTPDQLRGSTWRRVWPDVYADVDLPEGHGLIVRAVSLLAPSVAVFGGRTAALLQGAPELLRVDDPVEVVLPPGTRWSPRGRVRVRTAELPDEDVDRRHGLRVTSPVRTAVDPLRREPLDDAVVALDQLVQRRVVRLGEVRDAAAALPRSRGSRQARRPREVDPDHEGALAPDLVLRHGQRQAGPHEDQAQAAARARVRRPVAR